jgi:hypothetical protein
VTGNHSLEVPLEDPLERGPRGVPVADGEAERGRRPQPWSPARPESRAHVPARCHVPGEVAHQQRAGRAVPEDHLREQPVTAKQRLVELGAPAGIGLIAELTREREVPPPPGKPGRREQLDPRVGLAVLLHEEVAVR